MTTSSGLKPQEVIDSTFSKLETHFQDRVIDNFEREISLTPLVEYGQTKEEFHCTGFIFQTASKTTEIIFTAKRVITDDVGVNYGLRWCSCGQIENSERLKLRDYVSFKSNRRWVLAKPKHKRLLALGRNIPSEYRLNSQEGDELYSPDVLQYLLVEILVDRITVS